MAKAKAHKLLKNNDPMIDAENYNISLVNALNYFNIKYDLKERQEWVKVHYPRVKFGNHRLGEFQMLGNLCRLMDNGNELSSKHINFMESEFKRLTKPAAIVDQIDTEEPVVQKASIQDKMDDKVSTFLGEFAGLVDEFVLNRTIPKVEPLINGLGIRGPMVKKVLTKLETPMQEIRDALEGTDKQLVEGYSNFKKTDLKKLLGIYESLESALGQAKVMTVRKPRKSKAKPPAVIAKSVKYCKESTEYGLNSLYPTNVVGANEVWLFNVKTRKLAVYKSMDGSDLTFKGTTLLNWDTEKSSAKTIRKPLELAKLVGQGTRAWTKFYREINAKESALTGRFSEDTIILAIMR